MVPHDVEDAHAYLIPIASTARQLVERHAAVHPHSRGGGARLVGDALSDLGEVATQRVVELNEEGAQERPEGKDAEQASWRQEIRPGLMAVLLLLLLLLLRSETARTDQVSACRATPSHAPAVAPR
jgi:hypothetical protein